MTRYPCRFLCLCLIVWLGVGVTDAFIVWYGYPGAKETPKHTAPVAQHMQHWDRPQTAVNDDGYFFGWGGKRHKVSVDMDDFNNY